MPVYTYTYVHMYTCMCIYVHIWKILEAMLLKTDVCSYTVEIRSNRIGVRGYMFEGVSLKFYVGAAACVD